MLERIAKKYLTMQHPEFIYKNLYSFVTSSPIAISTLQTSAVYVFRLGIQTGSLILLGNLLGTEQFALFAAISATALILGSCTNLGLNLLLLKEVSNNQKQQHEILSYALPAILFAGITMLTVYVLLVKTIFNYGADQIEAVLAIGLAEIVITPVIWLISAIHLAARRTWLSQLLPILQNSFRLPVIIFLLSANIETPLDFYLCSYTPVAVFALLLAGATVPHIWPQLSNWRLPKLDELKKCSGFGALNVMNISVNEIDKSLIIKLIPATSAGMYVVGMRVIGAFVLPVSALLVSSLPKLFRKDRDHRSLIKWLLIATLSYGFAASGVIWLGADLIEQLFRNHFTGLESILRGMCLLIPGLLMKLAASNIFMTQKSAWYRVAYEGINITLLVVLFVIFCNAYGLQGAILAAIITEWAMGLGGWGLILTKKLIQRKSQKNV